MINLFMFKILKTYQKHGNIITLVNPTGPRPKGRQYIYSDKFKRCELDSYKNYQKDNNEDLLVKHKVEELSLRGTRSVK